MIEDLIETGQYKEALRYLNDLEDEKVRYQRLVCLYGMQELQQAKKEGLKAKALAEETYYDVVAIYVSILKDLEEFEEAINIIVEELSMPYIPYQYETVYNAAYDELLLAKQEASLEGTSQKIFNEEEIESAINEKTKALYIETLGNPNSDVVDIESITKIAHKHKIPLVVDNTFAS